MTTVENPRTERWCRTARTRDLGQTQGSGLTDATYLLRRGDGQVVQVSELLHLVVREVSAERTPEQVALAVSEAYGRDLSVAGLRRLITTKLEPLGLIEDVSAPATLPHAPPPRADPLLTLRLRCTLLPGPAVRACARTMAPIFNPIVIVLALVGLIAVDTALLRRGNLIGALDQVLATPVFLLALVGVLILGSLIHELGHAAACIRGGANPGVIGFGVYLVFPAFFTNVTDTYRLDRAGRLRTDLGGLYLNVWCLLALGGGYLVTGQGLLLLVIVLMHIEMLQQLLPTLRFDGYYVLADLAGVPDLFARVNPVLRSLLPGRPADRRVTELRPAARRLVIAWVAIVVPFLVLAFGWLLYSLPFVVEHTVTAIRGEAALAAAGWRAGDVATVALACLSIALLTIPLLGIALFFAQICLRVARRLHLIPTRDVPIRDVQGEADVPPTVSSKEVAMDSDTPIFDALSAEAFTDEAILGPAESPRPEGGWRKAVYHLSNGTINPGPSSEERRRADLLARVTTPISGSRRVAVMSRKGGVGKTTMTMALGATYAMLRGDRVVAVDANPDAGNLAHRVSRPCERTITDLLNEYELISSYADLRGYTAQAPESRLEVLASDDDPRIGLALDREAYHRVIDLLDHYYNLILLDTGTGILDSANQGLLVEADQLVVVLRPALDGARAAALTLDWLSEHGYGELVTRAVVVINAIRRKCDVPLERIEDHFARRCASVIKVPWDRALEAGAQTTLHALQPATREALTELAGAVADQFAAQTFVRSSVPLQETA